MRIRPLSIIIIIIILLLVPVVVVVRCCSGQFMGAAGVNDDGVLASQLIQQCPSIC